MKPLKILIVIAMSTIGTLFIFLLFAISPMEQSYQDCLQKISLQTGIEEEAIIFRRYPELKIAKANCKKVKSLRAEIEAIKGGPAPDVNQEQHRLMQQKQVKIKKLQQQNDHIFRSIEGAMADVP